MFLRIVEIAYIAVKNKQTKKTPLDISATSLLLDDQPLQNEAP